jgi:cytochrome c
MGRMSKRGAQLIPGLSICFILCTVPAIAASKGDDSIGRGHALLKANCSRCHSTEISGESPFSPAPPFRTLHQRYPVEDLEESLAEGIFSGHPAMPEFRFSPADISDIIAYLKSISR